MNEEQTCLKGKYEKLLPQIKGAVIYRPGDDGGYEVLDGNGEVQIWVRERELARQVAGLLDWFLELKAKF